MNIQQLEKFENLAKQFDSFHNAEMMNGNRVDVFKSLEFGAIVMSAQLLGFNIVLSGRIVMYLQYQADYLIEIDCDDRYAHIDTTKLWSFIEEQRVSTSA
ncbi:MAG: hypothetical protein K0R18_350 [Bacillales bacterium]|jgi:hypothetical protein|nr:hypothetical protein [Bacillales bacterium]